MCSSPFKCGHRYPEQYEIYLCNDCEKEADALDAFAHYAARHCLECDAKLSENEQSNYKADDLERLCDCCVDVPVLLDEATAEWMAESAEEDSL